MLFVMCTSADLQYIQQYKNLDSSLGMYGEVHACKGEEVASYTSLGESRCF
jgi:hypothetical protein